MDIQDFGRIGRRIVNQDCDFQRGCLKAYKKIRLRWYVSVSLTLETLFRKGGLGVVRIRRDVRFVFYWRVDLKSDEVVVIIDAKAQRAGKRFKSVRHLKMNHTTKGVSRARLKIRFTQVITVSTDLLRAGNNREIVPLERKV